jgi:2-polyprenyl-6-methoxyphenol hydroxylase-like FAD-dependent oxidoreductase
MKVAIVGCGTAGGAAALFLTRQGHEVVVFERVPDPRAVGAGIILQPTGQAVLARLGLEKEVCERGARLDGLVVRNATGRKIMELSYEDVGDLFGLGIHRGVLFRELFAAAKRETEVITGLGIDHLEGRRLIDEHGVAHGPYDLIVVADGAKSKLRDDITDIRTTIRPYPWGAMWFLASDPDRNFRGRLFQTVRGNARMLGFLPTGLGPEEGAHPVTSIYWSIRADRVDAFRHAGVDAWKEEIRGMLDPEDLARAEPLLAQIEHESQVLFTSYNDVEMWPWAHDRVVFLGDAAHAMSPQLGQGCNLALLDALTLAECMDVFATDVTRALEMYCMKRRSHLGVYTQATRWLTPFFQGDVQVLGDLRDLFMPIAAKIPFARALMTRSMAGVLGGWFGGTFPLPRPPS